jgi:hypothetical protein
MGTERFGRPLLEDRIAQIEPGRTTRAQVLALLGPPVREPRPKGTDGREASSEEPPEDALHWEYKERRERFATALLYTYFSQETLTDSLMIVFDERDIVEVVAIERETKR